MSESKRLRSFGLSVGTIFAFIGVWPAVWRGQPLHLWSLMLGGMFIVLALALPGSLTHVYRLWMTVGEIVGWLTTRLILGVLCSLLFTLIGLCRRLRGKDPMRRTWSPEAESYRVVRQPRPTSHMR